MSRPITPLEYGGLCRDSQVSIHWHTQNQKVRAAVVGNRWLHRAPLVRIC